MKLCRPTAKNIQFRLVQKLCLTLSLAMLCCLPAWSRAKPPPALKTRVTRNFCNADLAWVVRELAKAMGRNVYIGPGVEGNVTVRLRSVPPEAALAMILADAENEIAYKLVGTSTLIVAAPDKNGISCFYPKSEPSPHSRRREFLFQHLADWSKLGALQEQYPRTLFEGHPTGNGFFAYGSQQELEEIAKQVKELDIEVGPPDPIEEFVLVKHADKVDSRNLLATLFPGVEMNFDEENPDLLHLKGIPVEMEQAKELLDALDRPRDQIVLECKAAYVGDQEQRQLPVEWVGTSWTGQEKESIRFGNILSSAELQETSLNIGVLKRKESGLPFLITQSESHVLASPRVAFKSGQQGAVHIGDKFPLVFLDRQACEFVEAWEDLGLNLSVECIAFSDNRIHCRIHGELTCLEELLAYRYPRLRTVKFEGDATLADSQTLVIAGLITPESLQAAFQAVPLLGDLPIQGQLYRSFRPGRQLYLMITPALMK